MSPGASQTVVDSVEDLWSFIEIRMGCVFGVYIWFFCLKWFEFSVEMCGVDFQRI